MGRPRKRSTRVIAFIEKYCKVPEGPLLGRPMLLDPFQKKFIREVYDNPFGTTQGILSIGRKNGKSALIAALVLAHIVGPETRQNSQVVSGARSRKQAAIVFNLALKMVNLNPALRRIIRDVPSDKKLVGLRKNAEYQALAAEAGTTHGLSPALAILDELGQVKGDTDAFVEAIETAQGAYDDALTLIISTQAATDADMLSVRIDDAIRSADPTIVCHLYAADPDCDVMDPKQWKKANPALGKFRSKAEMEKKAAQAARMPSVENSFRNLYLNQRVNRFSPFLAPSVWEAAGGEVDEDVFARGPVWGGLDLAQTTDLCAFVLVAKDDEDAWHCRAWFWKPQATLLDHAKSDRQPYDRWAAAGLIETTPGAAVDYGFVAVKVARECDGLDVRAIAFDRYRFKTLEKEFAAIGVDLPFEPWGQGMVSMSPAIETTEIAFLNGKVRHGGNPVMTMCAANAVIVKDAAGNRKLDKSKSTGRIDGMQALVMALGIAASAPEEEGPGESIYDVLAREREEGSAPPEPPSRHWDDDDD